MDALLNSNKSIVFASGPAEQDRTMIAMLSAIKHYKTGEVDKIVCTRPAVGVDDEKLGFLPGFKPKNGTGLVHCLMFYTEYYSPRETAKMLDGQIIEYHH